MNNDNPAEPLCLITAAALSVQLQVSLSRVRQAICAIGARPHLTLNGIEHYDETLVLERCKQWLNGEEHSK
jgi:hypothetical protein